MAKFKNGNLIIDEGKKATIGSLDITENSFDEVLIEAENYIDTNDDTNASNIDSNIHFRLGNSRFVTSDSTANSGEILLVDATSGEVTITVIPENHARVTIKKIDASANKVNITSASGLIEGEEIYSLEEQYNSIKISCDGIDWWVVGGGFSEKRFIFEIYINTPKTFSLPINSGGAGYNHNFKVKWGDGTSNKVTSYNDPNRNHSYTSTGTYTITMSGVCEYFAAPFFYSNAIDFRKILRVDDLGFNRLAFQGCSNINYTTSFGSLLSLTNASNLFNSCTSLLSIPDNIFYECPNITTFNSAFVNCVLTSIPDDLFRYNTQVSDFSGVFTSCSGITSIPDNLFRYNTAAIAFSVAFAQCVNVTSIPEDLFKYNISATLFNSVFTNCTGVTSLPGDIFLYNLLATSFESSFSYCNNMTGTGQTIIDNTSLPGHVTPTNTTGCFASCTSLSDYATLPVGWK